MNLLILFLSVTVIISSLYLHDYAFAICCFPYDVTHYVDPVSGYLVVEGQLWNDSYRGDPFGNVNYQFQFYDSERNVLFERDLLLTSGLPIEDGFVIPPGVALPFHIVIDDVDRKTTKKIHLVSSGSTNTLEYFPWKPADIEIGPVELKRVSTVNDTTNQDTFYK